MSLSLTKYNVLFVWPHKVQLAQKSWLTKTKLDIKETFVLDTNNDPKHMLEVLKDMINRLEKWRPLTVILFGNKARYRLLEHHAQLSPSEFLALAEHQFKQILGQKAYEWQYFSQRINPERKNLTVALHSHWLDSIQAFLIESHIKFFSIQSAAPWLFNYYRHQFNDNEWSILQADSEVFVFKLNNHKVDHFKHETLKASLTTESIVRREILAIGDDPEEANYKGYDLNDMIKSQHVSEQTSLSTDQLIQQKTSS